MFEKVLRMLVVSVIILFIGLVVSLILEIIELFCPILFWTIGVVVLLWAGYLFGNKFG